MTNLLCSSISKNEGIIAGGGATRDNKGCMYAVKLQSYAVTGKTGILPPVTTPMPCNETLLK